MQIEINKELKIQGMFTLRKRDVTTGKVIQEVGPFCNLITNLGLNRLGTLSPDFSHCYVGTGTVPPAVTDTNMSTFKVASNSSSAVASTAPVAPTYFHQISYTYKFNAGTIAGNITEVGVGWSANPNGNLWSRELIVDSGGNPVTITVLVNEILEVVYTLRYYMSPDDVVGSFTLNSTVYNYTLRRSNITSGSIIPMTKMEGLGISSVHGGAVTLGPITDTFTGGTTGSGGSVVQAAYANNSYTQTTTTSFSLTQGNLTGGIKGLYLNNYTSSFLYQRYQMLLDTNIPKTNLNTMSFTFSTTWGRYTP